MKCVHNFCYENIVELEGETPNQVEFSLGNFKLELLEPFRSWRLWFNGYMRYLLSQLTKNKISFSNYLRNFENSEIMRHHLPITWSMLLLIFCKLLQFIFLRN